MTLKKQQGRRPSCNSRELALMESQQRILQEIETIKDEIRKAYSVQVRETHGHVPTDSEKRMIRDRDIANSVIDRVSESLSKIGVMETPETSYRPDNTKTFSLLQFFHLVKICQQSPPIMLASLYRGMETAALVHLGDTLMDASLKAAQSKDIEVRREYRHKVNTIMDKMTRGVNQPIEKGFTTTFQHIRHLLDALTDPEYPAILQDELKPLIPPLQLIPSQHNAPHTLPLPTVPFPKTMLAAYHNKLKRLQNAQHPEKKINSEQVANVKDQKKETTADGVQEEEKSGDDAQKDGNDAQKEAIVNGNIQEEENHKEEPHTKNESNSDARFEDADDDQVMPDETYHYDDLWQDEPHSPSPNNDLPHTQWENFKAPSRQRHGRLPKRWPRTPNYKK